MTEAFSESLEKGSSLSTARTQKGDIFDAMVSAWGCPVVARCEVGKFSGGTAAPRSLANADSLGIGPAGRFRVGKKIVYPSESLADWLRRRSREV